MTGDRHSWLFQRLVTLLVSLLIVLAVMVFVAAMIAVATGIRPWVTDA